MRGLESSQSSPLPLFPRGSQGGWSQWQLTLDVGLGKPWTGRQSITVKFRGNKLRVPSGSYGLLPSQCKRRATKLCCFIAQLLDMLQLPPSFMLSACKRLSFICSRFDFLLLPRLKYVFSIPAKLPLFAKIHSFEIKICHGPIWVLANDK